MTVEENKALIRRYVDQVYNEQDLSRYSEFVGDEISDSGADHLAQFFAAFPDAHAEILDLLAEEDKVLARLNIHGTHRGPFAGRPPTGKRVNFQSFRVYQIVGGTIVASWAMQDRLGLMEQLGFVQSPGSEVNWAADEDGRRA